MERNLSLKKKYKEVSKYLTCSDCGKSCTTTRSLTRHVHKFHPNQSALWVCKGCSKNFSCRRNLKLHEKKVCLPNKPKCSYPCPDCPRIFQQSKAYRLHQRYTHNISKLHKCAICFAELENRALLPHVKEHKINLKKSRHKFESIEQFFSWKTSYENETNSKYFQRSNKQHGNHLKYACAHPCSSLYKLVTRQEKYYCPSSMEVKVHRNSSKKVKKVIVTVLGTHLGHSVISEDQGDDTEDDTGEKRELPDDNPILDDTDLQGAFDLCTEMDNCDDALAVDIWIKDLQLEEVILFYKAEGCLFEGFEELELDESVLVIITSLQAKILQKYPSNTIYIDWCQATDLYLATILITDDKGVVFPCGFLIANRMNKSNLKVFLQHVKFKIGMHLHPNVLITGLDSCFFDAWVEVMGRPDLVWTCPWHIQEDWRKWLNVSLVAIETKEAAYQKLQALLHETDQNIFRKQLSKVQSYLSQFTPLSTFATHFKNNMKVNSITNATRWCLWNSKLTQESKTNFENMHRTLKSALWMGQKLNNRVDRTVGAIMRLVRDKSVNLISEDSDELQNIEELISANHEKSLEIDLGFVIKTKNRRWSVLSSDQTKLYEVKKVKDQCKCAVRCEECASCLHQYVCSCVDASFGYNMCKHIHLFCRSSALNGSAKNVEMPFSDDEENIDSPLEKSIDCTSDADENNDSDSSLEQNTNSSLEENIDSALEENLDSSSDENVDSLADQDYYITPHSDDRDGLVGDFQRMVDSASPKEFLLIRGRIETLKKQLSDVKKRKILHSLMK